MKTPRRSFLQQLAFGLMAGAVLSQPLVARADVLDNIHKNGVVRIAIPQDFPPFGSLGPDLKLRGYDIDMANLVAQEGPSDFLVIDREGPGNNCEERALDQPCAIAAGRA